MAPAGDAGYQQCQPLRHRSAECNATCTPTERAGEQPVEQQIAAAYRQWLIPCDRIEAELVRLEGQFGTVRHAQEFRNRRGEVEGMLTSDVGFFGDGLTTLCDAAVDEHRKGETLEHR